MTKATGHTKYEIFSLTCYSSLCTTITGIDTPYTGTGDKLAFDGTIATKNSPFFLPTDKLDFSVVGSWQVPARLTNFEIKLKGTLEIDSVHYDIFEFTFVSLQTIENIKTMSFSPMSPESGATTTLIMQYNLSRKMIEGTFFELKFPPLNL